MRIDTLEKASKILEIIHRTGLNMEHITLIEGSENYASYSTDFDLAIMRHYEPCRFEIKKTKEEYDILKEWLE